MTDHRRDMSLRPISRREVRNQLWLVAIQPQNLSRQTQLSYLAGLLDGEGHFCVSVGIRRPGRKPTSRPQIIVTNTNKEMVDWCCKVFGGRVWHMAPRPNKPHWLRVYRWVVEGDPAVVLGNEIRPYLITKREQSLRLNDREGQVKAYLERRESRRAKTAMSDISPSARSEP